MNITKEEIKLINLAFLSKTAQIQRSINTENDEEVKEVRRKQLAQYNNLQAKINTGELFNETPISKQK